MQISQIMTAIDYNVAGVRFVEDSDEKIISFHDFNGDAIGEMIVNGQNEVLVAQVEDIGRDVCYRWIAPAFATEYEALMGDEFKYAWENVEYTSIVEEALFLEIVNGVVMLTLKDVYVTIDLTDEEIEILQKTAEERGLTMDQLCNQILIDKIAEVNKQKEGMVQAEKPPVQETAVKEGVETTSGTANGDDFPLATDAEMSPEEAKAKFLQGELGDAGMLEKSNIVEPAPKAKKTAKPKKFVK